MEAAQVIRLLLNVLPDSSHHLHTDYDCFKWCWEELGDKEQGLVKEARAIALDWLKQNEVQNGKCDDR